jgi:superfamily II DNA or RNA helicase
MSLILPPLTFKDFKFCTKELSVYNKNNFTKNVEVFIYPFKKNQDYRLPIGFATKNFSHLIQFHDLKLNDESILNILRPEQFAFLKSSLQMKYPFSQAWNLKPSFGKTVTCLVALQMYKMNACVVVHRKDLKKQWEVERDKFVRNSNIKIDIIMMSQLEKYNPEVLVIDEAHACITKNFVSVLAEKTPKILIGLSGTFFRYDIMDPCLSWLFGPILNLDGDAKKILDTSTTRNLYVKIVYTGISLPPDLNFKEAGGWNQVLNFLMTSEKRNCLIIDCIKQNLDKNILVIVKFTEHGNNLKQLLAQENISSICYFANQELENVMSHEIIISTSKKIGTGISLNKLNCLILASDLVNYSFQCISRILRDGKQDAYIFDFVDSNFVLKKHFLERSQVYHSLNAIMYKQNAP